MPVSSLTDFNRWRDLAQTFLDRAIAQLESPDFLIQLATIMATGLLALWLAVAARRLLGRLSHPSWQWLSGLTYMASDVAASVLWLLLLWTAREAERGAGLPVGVASAAVSLLAAWVVIRLLSHVVRHPFLSGAIFVTAYAIAALDILGLLAPIEAELNRIAIPYGNARITALNIIRAVIVLAALLWLATRLRGFLERRISQSRNLTPSLQAMLVQVVKLGLPVIAFLAALPVVGLNLTAVTVFGGAFAVGAGLGLQRAVANLFSGFLLLSGGSVRPGDVIAVKDVAGAKTYGRVTSVGAIFVTVRNRDGIEVLVPNDSLVSNGVENWTRDDQNIRVKVPFVVGHGSDVRKVAALAVQAAGSLPRILQSPQPVCFLTGYTELALNFELRFWISDPMNGISNIKGECLLQIVESVRAAGIRMPFSPAPA